MGLPCVKTWIVSYRREKESSPSCALMIDKSLVPCAAFLNTLNIPPPSLALFFPLETDVDLHKGLSSTTDHQSLPRIQTEPTAPSETSPVPQSSCAEYPTRPCFSCNRSTKRWNRRATGVRPRSHPLLCHRPPRLREPPTMRILYKPQRRHRPRWVNLSCLLPTLMRACVAMFAKQCVRYFVCHAVDASTSS